MALKLFCSIILIILNEVYSTHAYCSVPDDVQNAQLQRDLGILNRFSEKYSLGYVCHPGFFPVPSRYRECEDGMWAHIDCKRITCKWLPDPQHGKRLDFNVFAGTRTQFECNDGYEIEGSTSLTCQSDGEWSPKEPPICKRKFNSTHADCSVPDDVPNAQLERDLGKLNRFSEKYSLGYVCDPGFFPVPSRYRECEDGKWTHIDCIRITCKWLPDPQHGRRLDFNVFAGNSTHFECNDGYEIVGSTGLTCQSDGEWSPKEPPFCERKLVTCPDFDPPIYNGIVHHDDDNIHLVGHKARIECNEGSTIFPKDFDGITICEAQGTWSVNQISCEEIDCGLPSHFHNGYIIGHHTTVGSVIYFSCNTRTTFDGPSFQSRCEANGTWSFPPPNCWGHCQIPVILDGTVVRGKESGYVNHGVVIEYQCNDGLVPHEGSSMKCNNGTWTTTAKCVPLYCPAPGDIQNGQVYKKSTVGRFIFKSYIKHILHGDRLEYECNEGYSLFGPKGATCVNGNWQPPLNNPGSRCVEVLV